MPKKPPFDGVVEAVRYTPEGDIAWVRVHERRGPAFGDHTILNRAALMERLRSGRKFVTGKRLPYMGASFETGAALQLVEYGGRTYIIAGESRGNSDTLAGVPRL